LKALTKKVYCCSAGTSSEYLGSGVVEGERCSPKYFLGNAVSPNDIRIRGNCTKFDNLILRKLLEIVATRCHILKLKGIKFDFGWGATPDPAGRAYSTPPNSLA